MANSQTKETLSKEHLKSFARLVDDKAAAESFHWFADHVELFPFQTHDQLTLQGYFLPALQDAKLPDQTTQIEEKPIFLHCVGYIETTVKYASYLHQIHQLGYEIYSFDPRYQGFSHNYPVRLQDPSSPTNIHSPSASDDETISLVTSFKDTFVRDLESFIQQFIHPRSKRIIYSGNSMSGLIGLLLQSDNPTMFEKIILATPAIMPRVPTPFHYLLYLLTNIGMKGLMATRFETDMHKEKLTHCARKLETWVLLHSMFPRQFKVIGLTFGFIYEFVKAGYAVLAAAPRITVPLLFLQADDDSFVDNTWMNAYYAAVVNCPAAKLLRYRNTYHEILTETDDVIEKIMMEIQLFLKWK